MVVSGYLRESSFDLQMLDVAENSMKTNTQVK